MADEYQKGCKRWRDGIGENYGEGARPHEANEGENVHHEDTDADRFHAAHNHDHKSSKSHPAFHTCSILFRFPSLFCDSTLLRAKHENVPRTKADTLPLPLSSSSSRSLYVSCRIVILLARDKQMMSGVMGGVVQAVSMMNTQMDLPAMQHIAMEYEKQFGKMEMTQEVYVMLLPAAFARLTLQTPSLHFSLPLYDWPVDGSLFSSLLLLLLMCLLVWLCFGFWWDEGRPSQKES